MKPYFHGSTPTRPGAAESTRDTAPNFHPPYLEPLSDLSRPETEGSWPSFNETAPLPQRNTVVKHHQRCLPDRAACNCADNKALQDAVDVVTDPSTGGRKGSKLARFDMIPPDVLWELAEHYGKGSSKYPDGECTCASSTPPGDIVAHQPECPALTGAANWQRGYSWRLSVAALHRHLSQWEQGEDVDAETGSSHLIAAVWHCVALRWFQLHNRGTDYREVKP